MGYTFQQQRRPTTRQQQFLRTVGYSYAAVFDKLVTVSVSAFVYICAFVFVIFLRNVCDFGLLHITWFLCEFGLFFSDFGYLSCRALNIICDYYVYACLYDRSQCSTARVSQSIRVKSAIKGLYITGCNNRHDVNSARFE